MAGWALDTMCAHSHLMGDRLELDSWKPGGVVYTVNDNVMDDRYTGTSIYYERSTRLRHGSQHKQSVIYDTPLLFNGSI